MTPLPSSTIILLRASDPGPFEVLMAKRHGRVTFAGVHAFPGGIVDPHDNEGHEAGLPAEQAWGDHPESDRRETALPFWIAALRELFEEMGVLLAYRDGALVTGPLTRDLAALRAKLDGRTGFARLLSEHRAVPATDRLFSFARWVTPTVNPKRFDTRFLVAEMPEGQDVIVDGTETESHRWVTPVGGLEAYDQGEMDLMPPTVRTLDDLSRFSSVTDVLRGAQKRRIAPACPEIDAEGDDVSMTYPSPYPDDPFPARRLVLKDGRWRPGPPVATSRSSR